MDHLQLPNDPISPRIRVPLICDQNDSAGWNFLDYPLHANPGPWPQALDRSAYASFSEFEQSNPSPKDALETFLQSWLFFSLLRTILLPHNLFDITEYIASEDDGLFLRTDLVPGRLQHWVNKLRSGDEDTRKIEEKKTRHYLYLMSGGMQTAIFHNCRQDVRIALSLLAEMLETAVDLISAAKNPISYCPRLHIGDANREKLIENGWCPFEINHAVRDFNLSSAVIFLSNMRKPDLGIDHLPCSPSECKALQIDLAIYKPRHLLECSGCESRGPDPVKVQEALDAGTYPLLQILDDGDISVEVVPYSEEKSYVAFSHVGLMASETQQRWSYRLARSEDYPAWLSTNCRAMSSQSGTMTPKTMN